MHQLRGTRRPLSIREAHPARPKLRRRTCKCVAPRAVADGVAAATRPACMGYEAGIQARWGVRKKVCARRFIQAGSRSSLPSTQMVPRDSLRMLWRGLTASSEFIPARCCIPRIAQARSCMHQLGHSSCSRPCRARSRVRARGRQ